MINLQGITRRLLSPILAAALVLACGPASAAGNADPYAPLFPSALELGRHKFAKPPVEVIAAEKLPGEFRLKLPAPGADWRAVQPDLSVSGAQRLAGFVSPQGMENGVVEVLTHRLTVEVNMVDWLLAVMIKGGVTILRTRRGRGAAGEVYEVLGILPKRPDGRVRLVRAAVYRSGQRLFVVRCMAADDAFAALAYYFAASTLLCKPLTMAPPSLVGAWAPYCLPGGLCFVGPARGRATAPWPGRSVQEVGYDLTLGGKVTGTLHIKAIMPPELAGSLSSQRLETLRRSLEERGVKVKWQGGGVALGHPRLKGEICFYRGKGWSRGGDVELYAFSWRGEKIGAVVWMLTVGQIANMPAWMHNKRTFEVVCQSLKTSGMQ